MFFQAKIEELMPKIKVQTNNPDQTIQLACAVGAQLKGGEVVELVSDIGGGKTTFTKGLALGAGAKAEVKSPSFVIKNEYIAGAVTLHHLDFYRLNDPGIMRQTVSEIASDKLSVMVIEWADIISDVLPKTRVSVSIRPTDDQVREITINYPVKLSYLIEGVKS
jgi:tRNA threonylcarbamoyladenosine biosynthesis protein TsaE